MSFIHLHCHSEFSFLDGASSLRTLARRCAELEMPALAITDHNNLSATLRWRRETERMGLHPITGVELTLQGGGHVVLLAIDREGYANLCQLITRAHLEHPRGEPQVSRSLLARHTAGVIALSGGECGEIARRIRQRRFAEARRLAEWYRDCFGPANFFLELQINFRPQSRRLCHYLATLAETIGVGVVATNAVHYARKQDFRAQDALTCIRCLTRLDEPHPERHINAELYLKSPAEMRALFARYPQALDNTRRIAERCDRFPLESEMYVPRYSVPAGETAASHLRKLTYIGARARYGRLGSRLRQRIDYELRIIEQLGFCDYFLTVWDVARFARQRGIRYAGRGSAADSVVAYCLYITGVDAFRRNLRFERFINPARAGNLPDIDLDFDARYRDDVTAYVTDKYGEDRVATVCTFQRYHARGAIRDVGKVLGFPAAALDRLAKVTPHIDADDLEQAFEHYPELRDLHLPRQRLELLLQLCHAIADFPRHIGTHLGGVVISQEPLARLAPLQQAAKGCRIIQYDKEDVEDLNLVKLDLLCLRMLSAVEDTVKLMHARPGGDSFSYDHIPDDDEATYELLHSGETAGVFQLESPAQRALQSRLKADSFEDIVASVALIRPGPIQGNMIEPFLNRRKGREPISYLHPKLQEILQHTYGVVLFQEQVIEIAVAIAGFTPGEADDLRRVMTHHRSKEDMMEIGENFIRKSMENGVSREVAETVFSYIQGYAGYGFCEAHAAAFGDTAYKTAYLLQHHPAYFYAGILNNQPMGFFPCHTIINEARRRGIAVLPPDINCSDIDYTVEPLASTSSPPPANAESDGEVRAEIEIPVHAHWGRLPTPPLVLSTADVEGAPKMPTHPDALRVGLKQVRGIREDDLQAVMQARAESAFTSLRDFVQRAKAPRDLQERLILCGAFDALQPNRKRLLWELAELRPELAERDDESALLDLRSAASWVPELADFNEVEKFSYEWDILGFCPWKHPMEFCRRRLRALGVGTNAEVKKMKPGRRVKVCGIVIRPHRPPTRSGRTVVFLSLEDETGLIDVTVFEKTYQRYARLLFSMPALLIEGRLESRDGSLAVTARVVREAPRTGPRQT